MGLQSLTLTIVGITFAIYIGIAFWACGDRELIDLTVRAEVCLPRSPSGWSGSARRGAQQARALHGSGGCRALGGHVFLRRVVWALGPRQKSNPNSRFLEFKRRVQARCLYSDRAFGTCIVGTSPTGPASVKHQRR